MSTAAAARKKKALDAAAAAPARTLGRGVISAATALSLGRGGGSAAPARSLGPGGGSAAPARSLGRGGGSATAGGFPSSSAPMDGFPFPPSAFDGSCGGGFPSGSSWFDAAGSDPSSPGSWEKDPRPSGGFMSYFGNQPHNYHLVGAPVHNDAAAVPEVEILHGNANNYNDNDNDNDNVRTERRILWTEEEDLRLMSAWIENSTDPTCGADRGGNQYWGEVVECYNKTTPPLRRRNLKQCKDRWHKINRWTDLFECAYVKARRVFTSGYSDQMWIDAAHKFYVEDNKDAKLGPFVGMEVWKMCRDVSKWKTYNEELRNARKRKSFHLEGGSQEIDENSDEMPKRPMGQKAAKKAALAAKGKTKGTNSDESGNSKESAIEVDKLDKYSKFQEDNNEKRLKLLELRDHKNCPPYSTREQRRKEARKRIKDDGGL